MSEPATVAVTTVDRRSVPKRGPRAVELVALFGALPGLLALGPRWAVSLGILASGLIAIAVLAFDPTFTRGELVRVRGLSAGLRPGWLRGALIAGGLFALTALTTPAALFGFPRHRPAVWAIVMVLYPLSAYAQEVVFRPFFFHRYGHLFSTRWRRILASGLVFGWAHIVVNNVLAMALASVGGILFASTYERSRSTMAVSLEHALYGDIAFTIGLGGVFYSTTRWSG